MRNSNKRILTAFGIFLFAIITTNAQVFEDFDGLTETTYGDYTYNGFFIRRGQSSPENAFINNAIKLGDDPSYLLYQGADGDGKDNGVGKIMFWYRSDDPTPTSAFRVIVSVNGGTFTQVGATVFSSNETYQQYSYTLNNPSNNIRVAIQKLNTHDEPMHFDEFQLTDYCVPTHSVTNYTPTSGPAGTRVTINGTNFNASTTVGFDGIVVPVTFVNSTKLIVEVPEGVVAGEITVRKNGCDAIPTNFDFIKSSGSCASELIISEVMDVDGGNGWYMELYNPTPFPINLNAFGSDYTIERFVDASNGFRPTRIIDVTGTVPAGATYVMRLGNPTPHPCSSTSFDFVELDFGINENDEIRLLKNGITIDVVFGPNNKGYNVVRNFNSSAPSATFDIADWLVFNTESCANLGSFSMRGAQLLSTVSNVNNCSRVDLDVTATAALGGAFTYQWKYNDGSSANWINVTNSSFNPGTVTGETSANLSIFGVNLDGYQFYCEVIEDGECTVGSNAAQITMKSTSWNGSAWSDGSPDLSTMVILNNDYDTDTDGSFSACSLIVNSGNRLNVDDSTYVEVQNDITIDGDLWVETKGNLVQNSDTGNVIVTASGSSLVNKTTTTITNWYDYTYWSSPVIGETVGSALSIAPEGRRFWYDATNFLDVCAEVDNDNACNPGHDDIDDNGDDWQIAAAGDTMLPGVGYAATVNPIGFMTGSYQTTFEGVFNNGVITTPIAYNGPNGDNDWNFVGNPYPGAISADDFFTVNSGIIDGAVYLWSHRTPPSDTTNGNEGQNFDLDDYAIINGSGELAGGDPTIPNRFIPSGQGVFVKGLTNTNLTFNNGMRVADETSNDQFFRHAGNSNENAKLWVNLTSDNGVFNQILVAYVSGATNDDDGMTYDAPRNLSTGNASVIYTLIDGVDKLFAIQGKAIEALSENEIIPVGFHSTIDVATLYTLSLNQFKGDFFNDKLVYLEDHLNQVTHNLSESDYSFTSEVGTFNDRFEINFKSRTLNNDDESIEKNNLSIVELENNNVRFSVNGNTTIDSVKILNLLGQEIYRFKGNKNTEVYNVSNLNSGVYIAQVKLSNGAVINKRAIKK